MTDKEKIDEMIDVEFDRLFNQWLIDNPTFANKGDAFIESLRLHFKYWFVKYPYLKDRSLRFKGLTALIKIIVWQFDCCPFSEIQRSVEISICGKSAFLTLKFRLRFSIRFRDMRTIRTLATRIFRINGDNFNTVQSGFVFNFRSQIRETPIIKSVSLAFSNPYPFAYVGQIFQRNGAFGAFSLFDKTFRNYVIFILLKSALLSRKLFEFALCGLGLLSLQVTSAMRESLTNLFNLFARKLFAVRIRHNFDNTEINSKNIFRFKFFFFGNIANRVQIKLAFAVNQINFAFAKLKKFSLMFAHYKRNAKATFDRPDRNQIVFLERNNSIVVSNRTCRAERRLIFGLNFITVSNFGNRSYEHLRRQIKSILRGMIDKFMEIELLENLILKRLRRNPITRFVCFFQSFKQSVGLHFKRFEFDIYNQFHKFKYRTSNKEIQTRKAFPPQLGKIAVSTLRLG